MVCRDLYYRGGAGGIRTRVQTRKPYAFYTLIPDFIFVPWQDLDHQPRPYPLNFTGASRPTPTIPDLPAPLDPGDSGLHPRSDVSSSYLVTGLSQ